MGLFSKKPEEEKKKALEEQKKKLEEQKKKLVELEKEEKKMYEKLQKNKQKVIDKMSKLEIKDGKLIPVGEKEPVEDVNVEPKGSPFFGEPEPANVFTPSPPSEQIPITDPRHPQHQEFLQHQQRLQQQAQQQAPPPQEPRTVQILLSDGNTMKVQVDQNDIANFVDRITETINDQSVLSIGNRGVNGRYIVHFTI